MADQEVLTGIFFDRTSAESAIDRLRRLGYDPAEISVAMNDDTLAREFADATGTHPHSQTRQHATKHAVIGGGLGVVIAGLAAGGSLVVLGTMGGLETPFAAGPLAGASTIGVVGGVIGALVGAGVPAGEARPHGEALAHGGILIAVPRRERVEDEARAIFLSRQPSAYASAPST